MENITWYAYAIFAGSLVLTIWLFLAAAHYSKTAMALIGVWATLQSCLGLSGFYSTDLLTGRFLLLVVPPFIFLITLFFTRKGKAFIDGLDLRRLTILHIIRIPVEITLLLLFIAKTIPEAMTFEGRNFDILSGVTAPVIFYFAFVRKRLGRPAFIIWNIACMALLVNVAANAALSLPGRYLSFGFERPNVAIGIFPFLLLPALLVPLVLFAHLAAIRQLVTRKNID